jgi:hypothetical protein
VVDSHCWSWAGWLVEGESCFENYRGCEVQLSPLSRPPLLALSLWTFVYALELDNPSRSSIIAGIDYIVVYRVDSGWYRR